jgi:hypothetical protein
MGQKWEYFSDSFWSKEPRKLWIMVSELLQREQK